MRVKLAILALGIASTLLGLSPRAKADTFVYNVTSTGGIDLDVTFELPTFQESVTTSTFIQSTPSSLLDFSLSGNSTGCSQVVLEALRRSLLGRALRKDRCSALR